MILNDIVKNSNYVTDEELNDENIVGMANTGIAEVNSKCSTNLPLFVDANLDETPYKALLGTWCLRLMEPYLAYSIAANDTDNNNRDFHYNRFLQAISEFKDNLDNAILLVDPETGEDTGYGGTSARMVAVDATDVTIHWRGWI